MPKVRCTVSNCEFWEEHNMCEAPQILITAGPAPASDKLGADAERLGHTPVRMAEECFCWTFQARQDAFDEDEMELEAGMAVPPLL